MDTTDLVTRLRGDGQPGFVRYDGFADPALGRAMLDAVVGIDCFLSQFIFKNPGAWGQPWHQDSFYFPFEPARPIVALWLAVTRGRSRRRQAAEAADAGGLLG